MNLLLDILGIGSRIASFSSGSWVVDGLVTGGLALVARMSVSSVIASCVLGAFGGVMGAVTSLGLGYA